MTFLRRANIIFSCLCFLALQGCGTQEKPAKEPEQIGQGDVSVDETKEVEEDVEMHEEPEKESAAQSQPNTGAL